MIRRAVFISAVACSLLFHGRRFRTQKRLCFPCLDVVLMWKPICHFFLCSNFPSKSWISDTCLRISHDLTSMWDLVLCIYLADVVLWLWFDSHTWAEVWRPIGIFFHAWTLRDLPFIMIHRPLEVFFSSSMHKPIKVFQACDFFISHVLGISGKLLC